MGRGCASCLHVRDVVAGGRSIGRSVLEPFVILAVAPEAEIDGRGFGEKVRDARQRFNELET